MKLTHFQIKNCWDKKKEKKKREKGRATNSNNLITLNFEFNSNIIPSNPFM